MGFMDAKETVRTHHEEGGYDAAAPVVNKRTKAKRHCARFAWLYLIVTLLIILMVVLLVVYVGYPHIARKQVKQARLEVLNQTYANPTPDTVDLDLSAVLLSDSSYHPTLYPFQGSLYLGDSDTAFSGFTVPQMEGTNGTISRIRQQVGIYDEDQFSQYSIAVLQNKTYTLHLKGKGGLKVGALPNVTVDYDKTIEQQGMNGLAGLEISNFQLLNETLANGTNARGIVSFPNPSTVSLDVGDASFNLYVAGKRIGNATIPNLSIVPGNNSFPIAITNWQAVVAGLLVLHPYACGVLPIDIEGVSSIVNGVEIPYLSKALQANNLTTELDIAPALRAAGLGAVIMPSCAN